MHLTPLGTALLLEDAKHAVRRGTFAGKTIVAIAIELASPRRLRPCAARRQAATLASPDCRSSAPKASRGLKCIAHSADMHDLFRAVKHRV